MMKKAETRLGFSAFFMIGVLPLVGTDPDALLPEMQRICSSIESEVKIVPKAVNASAKTKVYIINGLDCAHCAAKVEERINEVPGVENAVVDLEGKQATVRLNDSVPDEMLVGAVIEKGFEAEMLP